MRNNYCEGVVIITHFSTVLGLKKEGEEKLAMKRGQNFNRLRVSCFLPRTVRDKKCVFSVRFSKEGMIMTNLVKLILISSLTSALVGCSSVTSKKISDEKRMNTPVDVAKVNAKALTQLQESLSDLREKVSKKGPAEINFLASDMYLKASAAQIEGDYFTANVIYDELVKLVPDDRFVQKKYAVSLIRAGDMAKAETVLASLFHSSKSQDSQLGLILAGVYSSTGKSGSAKKIYSQILSKDAGNQDACVFLSKTLSLEEKKKEAVKLLKKCEKANPKSGVFSYYIGKIYIDQKDLKNALVYFKKSLKMDADFSQAVLAVGLIYEEKAQYNLAIKTYETYLKEHSYDSLILNRIVQVMFTNEKFKEVIPFAERLSDLEPDNLNLKVKLGILYTDNKEYGSAISVFKNLLSFAPNSDKILYYLGAIYQETKDFDSAIHAFGKIPESSGLYQDSTVQIANMMSALAQEEFYLKKDSYEKREKTFVSFIKERFNKLEKMKLDLRLIQASYFEAIGKISESIDSIEEFKKEEGFKESHKYYLASLYEKVKDFESSTELIMDVVEKNPANAHAWNFLGYSLVERGENLDLAHDYIQKAIKISPKDGYIRDSLGWYYYKKGHVDKALAELNKAIQVVPDDVSIQKHLAIVYTTLKDFTKAKKYLVKALKLTTDEGEKKELVDYLKDVEQKRIPASLQTIND